MTVAFAGGLALVLLSSGAAKPQAAPTPPTPPTSFDQLWAAHVKANAAGDAENARRLFREIRRLRIERNIDSLDELGLALVARGGARLEGGDRQGAEEDYRSAIALAPYLPDGHFALARALLAEGPLRIVPAIQAGAGGLLAQLPTVRGRLNALSLAIVVSLLVAFTVTWALAAALLAQHGGLLRHDLEEFLGPSQSRAASGALFLLLLLLPIATCQGWGWLPLWWLALLFVYMGRVEKAVSIAVLVAFVAAGPAVGELKTQLEAARNPTFWAAAAAVEGDGDRRAAAQLASARQADPEDRDLAYLLAANERRAGRYEEAAELYRRLLAADPGDAIARNNLANIEFARRSFPASQALYRAGVQAGGRAEVQATFFYNLSLAHLQKFEYQPATEAKSAADRLARELVNEYDRRWKYDSGDYAVVDLGLSRDEVGEKFRGAAQGVALRNVAAGGPSAASGPRLAWFLNRFTAFVPIFGGAVFLLSRWRGRRSFTLHCLRCGTPFCRHCYLGTVVGGLCSQCYHLFVVRDGVSGPARNRKLIEVQDKDARRTRIFHVLSALVPGAGHVYARWTLTGLALLLVWFSVLVVMVLADWVLPFTEAPSSLLPLWPRVACVLVLVLVWVTANRLKPQFDVSGSVRRPAPPRRVRAA